MRAAAFIRARWLGAGIVAFLLLFRVEAQAAATPDCHDFSRWDELLRKELKDNVGGYAFEIMQHGKVVMSGEHGFARAPWEKTNPSVPFTVHKIAPIASISKTITAVALLRLWEEKRGAFSLDQPFWPFIQRYVPEPNPAVKRITIRQVLMHRTGFPGHGDIATHKELAQLLRRPLAGHPGTRFDYHNNNYYLARVLIEEIAHESYPRYVQKHVLEPMGIRDMTTHCERRRPMCGYSDDDADAGKPGYPFAWDCTRWAGGAGWYGSVDDLAKFMHGLREQKVLSPRATAILFKDALGFDWEEPGFGKGGDWISPEPPWNGEIHSAVCYFPDDLEAALITNGPNDEGPLEMLEDGWTASRRRAVARHPLRKGPPRPTEAAKRR